MTNVFKNMIRFATRFVSYYSFYSKRPIKQHYMSFNSYSSYKMDNTTDIDKIMIFHDINSLAISSQ